MRLPERILMDFELKTNLKLIEKEEQASREDSDGFRRRPRNTKHSKCKEISEIPEM